MPECGMPAPLVTTPTVAHMTLESPSDKAITSLYRAALGPVTPSAAACPCLPGWTPWAAR